MNAHENLIGLLIMRCGSLYKAAQISGVNYGSLKRYAREGKIANPAYWIPLLKAANVKPAEIAVGCRFLAETFDGGDSDD